MGCCGGRIASTGYHGNIGEAVYLSEYGQAAPANPSTDGSRQGLWQTATVSTGAHRQRDGSMINKLDQQVKQWPTPDTQTGPHGARGVSTNPNHQSAKSLEATARTWATPNCMDVLPPKSPEALARNLKKGGCRNLREDVVYRAGQWGTPAANDANKTPHCEVNSNQAGLAKSVGLELQRTWATPQLQDGHNIVQDSTSHKTIPAQLTEMKTAGKLNPRWVETLMGLPVGWTMPSCASPVTIAQTNSGSWATESCRQQPSGLFEF